MNATEYRQLLATVTAGLLATGHYHKTTVVVINDHYETDVSLKRYKNDVGKWRTDVLDDAISLVVDIIKESENPDDE